MRAHGQEARGHVWQRDAVTEAQECAAAKEDERMVEAEEGEAKGQAEAKDDE